MSKISEAADAVQRFAAQHRAILDIADALTEVGSIEQAAAEAKIALGKTRDELNAVNAELAAAHAAAIAANNTASRVLTNADSAATSIIEKARYDAEEIVKAGRADAANLREVAAGDVVAAKEAAQRTLESIDGQVVAARSKLIDLNVQIDSAKITLANAESSLATLRENAQKILG